MIAQIKMKSAIGPLFLLASDEGLRGVYWKKVPAVSLVEDLGNFPSHQILAAAKTQIEEYLEGSRQFFEVPLLPEGTKFQRAVWAELKKIPYGHTCSYRTIAQKIKNPKAVRAVGSANGKNPLSLIVPCHRVIASDGTLGGYAGGLATKRKLLELEKNFA